MKLASPEGCGRFAGRVIRGVDAGAQTPSWMRERLERSGQRSISALVDVTNYIMLELGRPLHVYDLDKLNGPIVVRWGRKGEKVLLLNEQQVEVDESVLCITDDSGVIGLGGIMGGDSTKADATTANVFLESAFFYPEAIAGRARRYGFTSFSPYTRAPVIAVAEAVPFAELTRGSHERLYALKGEIVSRGIRAVLGVEMPVYPKRRFQHGSASPDTLARVFTQSEARYRRHFHALHA